MNEYCYSAVESEKTSRVSYLTTEKNKTEDSVRQDKSRSQNCQRSNERLKSSVLSRRLKVISDGDVNGADEASRLRN